jgi:hypothetical protein
MTTPSQRLFIDAGDTPLKIPLPPEFHHRRLEVIVLPADSGSEAPANPRDPEHIQRVLQESWGAWGHRSVEEIDRMIAESRENDWREPWEECRERPS